MTRAPRFLLFLAVAAGVPAAVACGSGPEDHVGDMADSGPSPTGTTTATTTTPTATATTTTTSVPPGCPDPGICGPGLYWDTTRCSCEVGTAPPPPPPYGCDAAVFGCPAGYTFDPSTCECDPPDSGPTPVACNIPGFGLCYVGETCVTGVCPGGGETVCTCNEDGSIACSGCVIIEDAGPPPPPFDASPPPPPPWDAGVACYIPGYGDCPSETSCTVGTCPDGVTPVTCFCSDGQAYCDGACQPGIDAGVLPP